MRARTGVCVLLVIGSLLAVGAPGALGQEYSWQRPQAKVLARGDLEWTPESFAFEKGDSVRYIDFENGGDDNSGETKGSPWEHHPWDENAEGRAAAAEGVHTYVFKRGSVYRGVLKGSASGRPGDPIRLTSDPSWGEGEAVLAGSIALTSGWRKADAASVPRGMPEPEKVWYVDLGGDWTPRKLWEMRDGKIEPLALARTPNWTASDPDDLKSEWWQWEKGESVRSGGVGIDTTHLTESPDYYESALVYTEWGIVMSTPVALPVTGFDAEKKALSFEGFFTPAYGMRIDSGMRYYLENKPQYLDDDGEWCFEEKGQYKGRLYLRLGEGRDPNRAHLEVGRHRNLIDLRDVKHLAISGLTFRFTNVWKLGAPGFKIYEDEHEVSAIRLQGNVIDAAVTNCLFEHVNNAVLVDVDKEGNVGRDIVIADNDIRYTDHAAVKVENSYSEYERPETPTSINDLSILRNNIYMTGMRPHRGSHGHTVAVSFPETAEIAGNILDRTYGAGLFIFGGKPSGEGTDDRPFTRILIHHNKATNTLLSTNDWGGIETWQGGPFYVYDNVSGNPGGYRHWRWLRQKDAPEDRIGHVGTRFGHAYYLDGSFKNYYFNNIAWGRENDLRSPLMNTAAFQEIHSYQNSFCNNTVYRFGAGSRRQAPAAGRNVYLGNIWSDISDVVFFHSQGRPEDRQPNQADAGEQGKTFPYETIGYARNVFSQVKRHMAVFEATGERRETVEEMRDALQSVGALASQAGVTAQNSPLRDAPGHDFRPSAGSPAVDGGVRPFVPWGLYGTVGEWHFRRNNDDPTTVTDDHWYMTPLHNDRETYYQLPTWPLHAHNVEASDYVRGPLEDWTAGALRLDGRGHYLRAELPDFSAAAAVIAEADRPATSTFEDWLTVTHPSGIIPGHPFSITVKTEGIPPEHLVSAELDCRKHGAWGGYVTGGGPNQPAGKQPLTFNFAPLKKAGLKEYVLLIYHSETGDWDQREGNAARITVPYVSEMGAASLDRFRTPDIDTSSVLVEAYVRVEPDAEGVLVEKMASTGYCLTVGDDGRLTFAVKGEGESASLRSNARIADGAWHQVLAEADRDAGTLTICVDGKPGATGQGLDGSVSLSNDAPFYVGGTPEGRNLAVTIDFLRVSRGTLADARTTIEELYEWQFNGPFLRDFCGNAPTGKARDAGAIEYVTP